MILKHLEFFYHFLSTAKNALYDRGYLETKKIGVPVISIGNLSFGGTGKTPFIEFLAENFQNKKIVIICRSYKAALREPRRVDLSFPNAAEIFGDEAVLLQKKLKQCIVWSGPSKSATAVASLTDAPDLVLVDDGFSHRKLFRNFDIVLFDSTRLQNEYYRESFASLKRAQVIILTKSQETSDEVRQVFKEKILYQFPELKNSFFELKTKIQLSFENSFPVFAFCGIATPDFFRQSLLNENYQIIDFESFSDHQAYSDQLQKKILVKYKSLLAKHPKLKLVTTEKDSMKINNTDLLKNLNVVNYKIEMDFSQKENLLAKICSNLKL